MCVFDEHMRDDWRALSGRDGARYTLALAGFAAGVWLAALWPDLVPVLAIVAGFGCIAAGMMPIVGLVGMEADGRLDQIRMFGRPPWRAFWTQMAKGAGPWVAFGGGLLAVLGQSFAPTAWLMLAVAVVGGAGWSMLIFLAASAMPQQVDTRIVGSGLAIVAGLVAFQYGWLFGDGAFPGRLGEMPLAIVLAVESVIVALLARFAVGVYARRRAVGPRIRLPRRRSGDGSLQPPLTLADAAVTGGPRLRVAALAVLLGAGVAAGFVAYIELTEGRRRQRLPFDEMVMAGIAGLILVFTLVLTSSRASADRRNGRLELDRLVPRSSGRTLLLCATRFWVEPVVVVGAMLVTQRFFWGYWPPGAGQGALILCAAAPLAMVEGWRGLRPLVLTLPAVAGLVLLAVSNASGFPWRAGALLWIPWAAAYRTVSAPDAPPLSVGMAAAAAVAVAAALLWPY